GAWPTPPWITLPMMTSSISSVGIRARSTAARIAAAPSSGAESDESPPRNLPIGVRAAERMTADVLVSGIPQVTGSSGQLKGDGMKGGYRRLRGSRRLCGSCPQCSTVRLSPYSLDKLPDRNDFLLLPRPACAHGNRPPLRLPFADDRHVGNLHHFTVADAIVECF